MRGVGRRRELEVLVAAFLAADRHVLLEGRPALASRRSRRGRRSGRHRIRSSGNAELTPARLAGQFDPSAADDGYTTRRLCRWSAVEALRHGSLLYVEELNRVLEETVNLLITVMSEGELTLPRLGTIPAADGFRLVAAMNPFDNIGTAGFRWRSMTACVALRWIPTFDDESDIVVRNTKDDRAAPGRRCHTRYSQPPRCACRFIRARAIDLVEVVDACRCAAPR